MIFMELRCEDSSEPHAAGGWVKGDNGMPRIARCWSHDNNGCGTFSEGTQKGAQTGARELISDAKQCGWKKLNHGWVCPFCIEQRDKAKF